MLSASCLVPDSRAVPRAPDRALHRLEAVAIDLGVVLELGEILRRRLDRDRLVRAGGRLETSTDQ